MKAVNMDTPNLVSPVSKIHFYKSHGDKPCYVTDDEHRRTTACGYIRDKVTKNGLDVTCKICLRKPETIEARKGGLL